MTANESQDIQEGQFATLEQLKQYFRKIGRSEAEAAAAWQRGYRGQATPAVPRTPAVKHWQDINEDAMMGKIESTGKIVRIIRKQHSVKFSDQKDWLLIDTDPEKGDKGAGLKWVPASTRFEWVRPYRETVDEKINNDITKQGWHAEKTITLPDVGPLTFRARNTSHITPPQFIVDVFTPDNKDIGYFRFLVLDWEPPKTGWFAKKSKKDPYVIGGNVKVWSEYQKKGIATAVYQWVKSLGNDVQPSTTQTPAGQAMWRSFKKDTSTHDVEEDYGPNDTPPGPETKPTMPAGTVKVDVSDVYDWYKLGQHISNLKGLGKHDFGQGPPSTIISFGSEEEEHKYIKDLEKTGLTTTDIDPVDRNQPPGMKRQKVDPTYNVDENFADGKGPGRPGDSQRHGIPKGATMAQLEKAAKAPGRKGQLARWQINMRRGKKK
jgi:hypothetical protein